MNKFVAALSQNKRVVAGVATALGTVGAFADGGPDTSAITTAGTNVAVVGTAVFAVYVGVKTYKWFRSAL